MGQAESKMEAGEGSCIGEPPISCEEDAQLHDESNKDNFLEEDSSLCSFAALNNDNDSKPNSTIGSSENTQMGIEEEMESSNQFDKTSMSKIEEKILSSSVVSEKETTLSSECQITDDIEMPEPDLHTRSVADIKNDFNDNHCFSTAITKDIKKDISEQSTSSDAFLIEHLQTDIKTNNELLPNRNLGSDDYPKISEDLKLFLYNDFKSKIKTFQRSYDYELNWISTKQNLFGRSTGRKELKEKSPAVSCSPRSTSNSSTSSNETYSSESSLEQIILKLYPKEKPPPGPLPNPDDYKEALLHTNALIFAGSEFLKSFAEHGRNCKMGRNLVSLLDTILISIGQLIDVKVKDPFPPNIDSVNFNSFHKISPQYICTRCHEVVAYKVADAVQHIISGHQIICKKGKKKDKKDDDDEHLKKEEAKQEKKKRKKERRATRKEKKMKMLQQDKLKNGDKNSNQMYQKQEDSMESSSNTVDNHQAKEESPPLRSSSNSSSQPNQISDSMHTSYLPNKKDRKSSSRSTSTSSCQATNTAMSNKSSQLQINSKQRSQQKDPTKLQQEPKKEQQNPKLQKQIPKKEQQPPPKQEQQKIPKMQLNPSQKKEQEQQPSKREQKQPSKREQQPSKREQQQQTRNEEKAPEQKNELPGNQQKRKLPKEPRRQRSQKSSKISYHLPKKARALINNNMEQFFIDHVLISKTLQHLSAYDVVEKQLMEILKELFPNKSIKLYKFGSRISGIGNRDSDLDIFVDIDNSFDNFELRGSQSTVDKVIKFAQALKSSKNFRGQVAISHARVPIVKTTNVETNIDLDIGFSNSLGFCNTKLVAYFIELQPIARCLCVFMKKWMDRCKLSDSLSSYSVVMMVIYFLQVHKLLPPVQKLQMFLPNKFLVGPWIGNCAELPLSDFGIKEVEMNGSSVKLMLQQFFEFYSQFNFEKYVICPYFGQPNVLIQNIEKMLPKRYMDFVRDNNEWRLEIQNKPIIVQDPLQLSRNLMQNISPGLMKIFKQYILESYQYFKEL